MTPTDRKFTILLMTVHVRLNEAQIDRLSEVLGNLGLVFVASWVLPSLFGQATISVVELFLGTIASIFCVIGSLAVLKGN